MSHNMSARKDRVIIGYSIRRHPRLLASEVECFESPFLAGPPLQFSRPLSLSIAVWDALERSDVGPFFNGTNLLPLPDTFGIHRLDSREYCLVAVDLSAVKASELKDNYDLTPLPSYLMMYSDHWFFAGYDVVSLGGLSSGLYSYFLKSDEIPAPQAPEAAGNQFGLIDELADAEKFERFFDEELPSHAPFLAAGVWIKIRALNDSLVAITA
jgi:hypothetical protein